MLGKAVNGSCQSDIHSVTDISGAFEKRVHQDRLKKKKKKDLIAVL